MLALLCAFSAVVATATAVEVVMDRGGAKFLNPDFDEYGNNVIPRNQFLSGDARMSWVDLDAVLPNGTLLQYYFYMHNISHATELTLTDVRLQIWRPEKGSESLMMLAWQETVTVSTQNNQGALYKINVTNQHHPIYVYEGDRIGWGLADLGVITYDAKDGHRTAYRAEEKAMSQVGTTYEFGALHFPSEWSVGVKVIREFIEAIPIETTEAPTTVEIMTTQTPTSATISEEVGHSQPTVASSERKIASINKWNVYGPIIGVAVAAVLGSILVITVYKWKQHQQKSVTPQFTA